MERDDYSAIIEWDLIDFAILKGIWKGRSLQAIAESLNISQPAVSHRIRMMNRRAPSLVTKPSPYRVQLTELGVRIALQGIKILNLALKILTMDKK